MLINLALAIAIILMIALVYKALYVIQGSGLAMTKEDATLDPFKSLSLSGIGEYTVTRGDRTAVTMKGDDNIIPLINLEVRGGQLTIGFKKSAQPKLGVQVSIVTPNLEKVEVSGVAHLTSSHEELRFIELSGAAKLEAKQLSGERLDLNISGTGSVTLSGELSEVAVDSSGVSIVDATELQVRRGDVTLSGAGLVQVNASETLKVELSGLGKVEYLGQPQLDKNVSGLGTIKPLEP